MLSRILIADVNPNIQQMVSQALASEQIETVFASDGWSALNLLNETTPDLLIAEISLPEKSGYELCRYVRTEPEFQSLPVILLDDHFDVFNQSAARSLGADVYLSKPFDPGSVVGAVRSLLASRGDTRGEAPAPTAQTPQQSLSPERASGDDLNSRRDGNRIVTGGRPRTERAVMASSPQAAVSRPQPRRRISLLRWAALAGALLAVIGLAILERTLTSRNASAVGTPTAANSAVKQDSSAGEQPRGDADQSSERLATSPQQKEDPEGASASSERTPDDHETVSKGDDTVGSGNQVEAGRPPMPGAPRGLAEGPNGADGRRDAEPPPSASAQAGPYAAPPDSSPPVNRDQRYGSARRPRAVGPIRPATTGGHLKRGGREMREAGEHFGSGVKHFWKSGEKAAVSTGKKVGGGVKRMGKALKKIF
ncbi:MAG: response regulator [Blastocatellia bacterium]